MHSIRKKIAQVSLTKKLVKQDKEEHTPSEGKCKPTPEEELVERSDNHINSKESLKQSMKMQLSKFIPKSIAMKKQQQKNVPASVPDSILIVNEKGEKRTRDQGQEIMASPTVELEKSEQLCYDVEGFSDVQLVLKIMEVSNLERYFEINSTLYVSVECGLYPSPRLFLAPFL